MAFLGVYGHVNLDTILVLDHLPAPNETVPVVRVIDRLGGTAGTIARTAAALKVPTALASFVGEDFPDVHRTALEALGIDLTDLKRLPGRSPRCWLLSVPGGDTSVAIDQGVYEENRPKPRLDYTLLNSQWVHITTGDWGAQLAVAKEAKRIGKRVAFDPAQELSYRFDARRLESHLNASHVFWANQVELGRALKLLGYGDPAQLFDHVETIIVTKGALGAELRTEKETRNVPAAPIRGTAKPESTGAGDALRGGFYAGLHAGKPMDESLRWGAAAASLFLAVEGNKLPDRAALDASLRERTA